MKKSLESLIEYVMKIINFKKKKMKVLTNEQQNSYQNSKICYICKEQFKNKFVKNKNCCKVRDHSHYAGKYRGTVHSIFKI